MDRFAVQFGEGVGIILPKTQASIKFVCLAAVCMLREYFLGWGSS